MKKKILIIINNRLAEYYSFFNYVKENSHFTVYELSHKDPEIFRLKRKIEGVQCRDIILAVSADFFKDTKQDCQEFMNELCLCSEKNILYLYTQNNFLSNPDVLSGARKSFYISNPKEYLTEGPNFILYVIRMFSERVTNFRLEDYITTSFKGSIDSELLKKKNEEIERLMNEVRRKSRVDSLTNLYNRATIYEYLDQERSRSNRDLWYAKKAGKAIEAVPPTLFHDDSHFDPVHDLINHYGALSVMLIDVDRFKKINDTHGHLIGDEVLKTIGQLLMNKEIFRDNDLAGRWGGEEFLVILPDTNVSNALEPAQRLAKKLALQEFSGTGQEPFKVTVSIGISQSSSKDLRKEDLINRADQALYYAKEHGRNKITVYEKIFK